MGRMQWDQSMSVNIDDLDAQHRKLLDMVNRLHDALDKGDSGELGLKIVSELKEYAQEHFSYEESLMMEHGYPGYAAHQQEHINFIKQVAAYDSACRKQGCPLPGEILGFLERWLLDHIKGTDQKYAPYLLSKGVS